MWSGTPATHRKALRVIDDTAPDLAVLDISVSHAQADRVHDVEGLRVAELVRADYPDVGLLMPAQHLDARSAMWNIACPMAQREECWAT
jgi:hypothetical protein